VPFLLALVQLLMPYTAMAIAIRLRQFVVISLAMSAALGRYAMPVILDNLVAAIHA
jgi:hypothetical protein